MSYSIIAAAHMASVIHENQTRSDGTPYIYHPMRVAGRTMLIDGCEQMVMAAWLHDTLEDQPMKTDLDRIRQMCGVGTVILIRELTNVFEKDTYPDWNRKKRKEHELVRLSKISPEGQAIKILDRLDNLGDKPKKNDGNKWLSRYLEETDDLMNVLIDAPSFLLTELKSKVKHLRKGL
jgi:(p)ppGpp synthase/HD superfamily hydrolase